MSLIDALKSFLQSNKKEVPKTHCPNCWGRQDYGGKFYEAALNEGINSGNLSEKVGWVEAYAQKHLLDIELTKTQDDEMVCSSCKVRYKPSDS